MTARPQLTAAQRRAAVRALAASRRGLLVDDGSMPPSTWRRMLGRMWLAGLAEATADGYAISDACRAALGPHIAIARPPAATP